MKYFISSAPAHEKISRAGQWTLWESKWCKVRHVNEDGTALLLQIDYPVKIEYLDRYIKVLRPQPVEKAPMASQYVAPEAYKWDLEYANQFPDEIVIPDEYWMEFLSRYVKSDDIIIRESSEYNGYNKIAIPYTQGEIKIDITRLTERVPVGRKSGVEIVIDALRAMENKNAPEHDDNFKNHELATTAMYFMTRNTNLLGKTVQLPHRTKEQTINDLADAAATIICEINRIIRAK